MARQLALAFSLATAACASEQLWTRPGMPQGALEQDKLRCTEERYHEELVPEGSPPSVRRGTYRWRRVDPDCMRALGYQQDLSNSSTGGP